LYNPRNLAADDVVKYLIKIVECFDASTSGKASRFNNPHILAIE